MKYTCSKQLTSCEFFDIGKCNNVEDCDDAIIDKPLSEWTLQEAKTECASREDCSEPTFCPFRKDNGYCRLGENPHNFNLTEDYK